MKKTNTTLQLQQEAYLCLNRHGHIVSSSASIQGLLGFSPELLSGRHINTLCLEPDTLNYLNEIILRKGHVEQMRTCIQNSSGSIQLLDCCASRLKTPDGQIIGTEILLKSLSSYQQSQACPQLKISIHGNILQANHHAQPILSQWKRQQGQTLPQFLAPDLFQAWANSEVCTKEYQEDDNHIYIFVPQLKLSLITLHVLSKVAYKSTHSSRKASLKSVEQLLAFNQYKKISHV
ncbi:MAG: PAS domain-containing protein [Mariprofundaceae bacterium]|nr:PAS domain-containing protein [Mariprofundaceae bacterium]